MAELFSELWETVGTSTQTLVDAAARLKDELPEGTPPDQVTAHLMQSTAVADAQRGMKSRGYQAASPAPVRNCRSSTSTARYMGTGEPVPLAEV